jgi:hypothetical protein
VSDLTKFLAMVALFVAVVVVTVSALNARQRLTTQSRPDTSPGLTRCRSPSDTRKEVRMNIGMFALILIVVVGGFAAFIVRRGS